MATLRRKFLLAPRTIRLGQINMGAITYYLGEKNQTKLTCQAGQAENKRPVEKRIRRSKGSYKCQILDFVIDEWHPQTPKGTPKTPRGTTLTPGGTPSRLQKVKFRTERSQSRKQKRSCYGQIFRDFLSHKNDHRRPEIHPRRPEVHPEHPQVQHWLTLVRSKEDLRTVFKYFSLVRRLMPQTPSLC